MAENPFHYGEVVSGRSFTDRRAEIEELTADLRNGQNVVIISPRRYGKTSLVLEVAERLRNEGVLIAYLDLLRTPFKAQLADRLAEAIYNGVAAPFQRLRRRVGDIFRNLPTSPKVTLSREGTPSFEFTAQTKDEDWDRVIEGLLAIPAQVAMERKRRVVLILDEFQEIIDVDPHLPALMRSIFQHQNEVVHVFLGSRRHLMTRVFTAENQPMYRLAKPLLLQEIGAEDFAKYIRTSFLDSEQKITVAGAQRILETTGGHPHDTQELCYFTWSLAQARGLAAVPRLVDEALARVLEAENARFITLWESLSPHRRLLLTALAHGGSAGVYSESYRLQHRLGAASTVQRTLKYLIERDLIEYAPDGRYVVTDVFLRAWLKRGTR